MNFSPVLCGAFIGGMWCVLVIFGAHRPVLPIAINDIAQNGRQNLLAFAGAFGIAFANQGVLTIPVYAQAGVKGFLAYLIGCAIAFFGSAILTYIVGFKDIEEYTDEMGQVLEEAI